MVNGNADEHVLRPEHFGARGDGASDDRPAFESLAARINAAADEGPPAGPPPPPPPSPPPPSPRELGG